MSRLSASITVLPTWRSGVGQPGARTRWSLVRERGKHPGDRISQREVPDIRGDSRYRYRKRLRQVRTGTRSSSPGGPLIETHAKSGTYFELPYTVKGMDLAFSGLVSAAKDSRQPLPDVCCSLQETAFAMCVEVTERALSLTGKGRGAAGRRRRCKRTPAGDAPYHVRRAGCTILCPRAEISRGQWCHDCLYGKADARERPVTCHREFAGKPVFSIG